MSLRLKILCKYGYFIDKELSNSFRLRQVFLKLPKASARFEFVPYTFRYDYVVYHA